jgi:transposase
MSSMNNGVVAGIDVHKAMLAVVVARLGQNETEYVSRKFGAGRWQVKELVDWLLDLGVGRVAMESTAQYWKPVGYMLEPFFELILAQPRSTAAPRGRKMDFADAKRIVRRLLADDLTISFVPEAEQRRWRLVTRARTAAMQQITRLRNQIEGLLEEGQIKLSGLLSDLLGLSGWRMLRALANGKSDPKTLAKLAHEHVRASQEQLREALDGRMDSSHRLLLRQSLDQIEQLRQHVEELDQEIARLLRQHEAAVERLCAVPGISLTAAFQIVAEVGSQAKTFASPGKLASWASLCPGREESAGVSVSNRCARGNRTLKRVLTQCAWAAVRNKKSQFHRLFQRWRGLLGAHKAIIAVAHRMLIVIWKLLHETETYTDTGCQLTPETIRRRMLKCVKGLEALGYCVTVTQSARTVSGPAQAFESAS